MKPWSSVCLLEKCKFEYFITISCLVAFFLISQLGFCRITNLKYWGRSEQIISKTLQLLNDLSVGYTCVRKLVKLEEVQFMLNNHTVLFTLS